MFDSILVPRSVLVALEASLDGACAFWACPGPDVPHVQMATCRACAARQELRALLAAAADQKPSKLTMNDFITYWGITLVALTQVRADDDFHQGDPGRSWAVKIGRAGRDDRITVPFHQGSGLTDEPTLADVLSCLANDAALVENTDSFESWAAELGYDLAESAMRARRTYDAACEHDRQLQLLLGDDGFHTLLWETASE